MASAKTHSAPAVAFYTTHQVSRMLGVSLATVVNWSKRGRLDSHRTPGGHRRISRESLFGFCREYDYPIPVELQGFLSSGAGGGARVLIAHSDTAFAELLRDYLVLDDTVSVQLADQALDVGFRLAIYRPQVVLLDLSLPGARADKIAALARLLEPPPKLVGCVTLGDHASDRLVEDNVLVDVLARTTPVAELAKRLRSLLSS